MGYADFPFFDLHSLFSKFVPKVQIKHKKLASNTVIKFAI